MIFSQTNLAVQRKTKLYSSSSRTKNKKKLLFKKTFYFNIISQFVFTTWLKCIYFLLINVIHQRKTVCFRWKGIRNIIYKPKKVASEKALAQKIQHKKLSNTINESTLLQLRLHFVYTQPWPSDAFHYKIFRVKMTQQNWNTCFWVENYYFGILFSWTTYDEGKN